jgi:hypothetical protein
MKTRNFSATLLALLAAVLLSACGSTSKLKSTESAKVLNLSDYSVVYVADFADQTKSPTRNADKEAIYRQTVKEAGVSFADMIRTNIEKLDNAPQVVRAEPAAGDQKVLRVEGEITIFKRGNALAKMLLPLAGSTKFNANVRFSDLTSSEKLGEIIVDKNSNPLGGGYAATQTTRNFMSGAAEKVAEELDKTRGKKE